MFEKVTTQVNQIDIYLMLKHNPKAFFDCENVNIYIFIAIALDESIFLDVLHSPMKIIKSLDLEATHIDGATSKPGPSCSKLTTSLVNDSSKFQT